MMKHWGTLVLVTGPIGAGKDSIIKGAQRTFEDNTQFLFPRRVVTRKADIAAENHDNITDMAFALNVAKGDYAVLWKARGNGYGLPLSIEDDLRVGRTVIFNCSRTVCRRSAKALSQGGCGLHSGVNKSACGTHCGKRP